MIKKILDCSPAEDKDWLLNSLIATYQEAW